MKYTVLSEIKKMNSDINYEELFVPFLIENNITVSTGESLTAGLIAATIANVAGASNVLEMGLVTYTEDSKMKLLNVSREILKECTAVSFETVVEMLRGLNSISSSLLNIVATGYAGPGENSGLVYIGISYKDSENIFKLFLKGSRNDVRKRVVNLSLYLSKKIIADYEGSKRNVGKVFLA